MYEKTAKWKVSTAVFVLRIFLLKIPESRLWKIISRNGTYELQGPPTDLRLLQGLGRDFRNLRSWIGLAPTALHIRTSEPPRLFEPFHRLAYIQTTTRSAGKASYQGNRVGTSGVFTEGPQILYILLTVVKCYNLDLSLFAHIFVWILTMGNHSYD